MSEKTKNKEPGEGRRKISLKLSDEEREMLEFLKTYKKTTGLDIVQRAIHHNHGFVCPHCREQIY